MLNEDELRRINGVNPLDQELSLNHSPTFFDKIPNGNDDPNKSRKESPLQLLEQTRSFVVIPIKNEGNKFVVQKDVEAHLECHIPPSAADGRWSATMKGTSLVRGPVGCATGSLLVHYAAHPKKILLSTGMIFGDTTSMTYGCNYSTRNQLHHISVVLPKASEPKGLVLQTKRNFHTCVLSTGLSIYQRQLCPDFDVAICSKTRLPWRASLSLSGRRLVPTAFQIQVSPLKSEKTTSKVTFCWNNSWSLEMTVNQMLGTKDSWVGMAVQHSRRGLSWIFSFIRGDTTIRVPVHILPITHDVTSYVMQGASLSLLTWVIQDAVRELWGTSEMGEMRIDLRREQCLLNKSKAKTEAQQQKELMVKLAKSRTKTEEAKAGLVIKKAVYWHEGGDVWDVTTQLQFWVNDSTLALPASSKRDLLGFYDVSVGSLEAREGHGPWWAGFFRVDANVGTVNRQLAMLRVEYDFNGTSYWIIIPDNEPLTIPSNKGVRLTT